MYACVLDYILYYIEYRDYIQYINQTTVKLIIILKQHAPYFTFSGYPFRLNQAHTSPE